MKQYKYLLTQKVVLLTALGCVVLVGVYALLQVRAATPFVSSEAESGTQTGQVVTVNDATASGSKTVLFRGSMTPSPNPAAAAGLYYTSGSTIYDHTGKVYIFKGVAMPSMSWESTLTGELTTPMLGEVKAWNANVIRVPLNINHWLNNTNNYQTNIKTIVGWIKADGMNVDLDLHTAEAPGASGGPASMPPRTALTFWSQVAKQYKNDPSVIFELFNEPHDITSSVWHDGSSQYAGYQEMYKAVRGSGALNIVLIGGTDYAYDLTYVHANPIIGTNIVYSTHPYDGGDRTPAVQETAYGFIVTQHIAPVMLTEFGNRPSDCAAVYPKRTLDYITGKGMSWIAWAYFESGNACGFPSLINSPGRSLTPWGTIAKSYMLK